MTQNPQLREIYEDLVHLHSGDIYRYAYRLCGDRNFADDLVQETYCEAWRSIATLRDPMRGRAWLFQILRYRNLHAIRDRSRRIRTPASSKELDQFSDQTGTDVLRQLSDREVLQRALASLDERYREPFLMVFLEDLSCREAAVALDIPLGTVLSRIHRARIGLRRFISQTSGAEKTEAVSPLIGCKQSDDNDR